MLLHRNYGNYLNHDLNILKRLIKKAFKKERDDKLWQVWLVLFDKMREDNYISFEDYKRQIDIEVTESNKTIEELFEMAEQIKKADLRR